MAVLTHPPSRSSPLVQRVLAAAAVVVELPNPRFLALRTAPPLALVLPLLPLALSPLVLLPLLQPRRRSLFPIFHPTLTRFKSELVHIRMFLMHAWTDCSTGAFLNDGWSPQRSHPSLRQQGRIQGRRFCPVFAQG